MDRSRVGKSRSSLEGDEEQSAGLSRGLSIREVCEAISDLIFTYCYIDISRSARLLRSSAEAAVEIIVAEPDAHSLSGALAGESRDPQIELS